MLYYYSYVTDTEEMPLGVSSTDLDMVRTWAQKTVKQLEKTAALVLGLLLWRERLR